MIAGHFGLAAAAKSRSTATPLWALMLATQWLDVVFVPLLVLGVERLEPIAGSAPGAYGEVVIWADYTHSLLGAMVLSALFAAATGSRYGRRSGVMLGLTAFSHWLLDLVVHRADMPLLPGNWGGGPRLGLGLWRHPLAAATVELMLVWAGAFAYWRAAQRAAGAHPQHHRRANGCALGIALAGALTLALNVAGL